MRAPLTFALACASLVAAACTSYHRVSPLVQRYVDVGPEPLLERHAKVLEERREAEERRQVLQGMSQPTHKDLAEAEALGLQLELLERRARQLKDAAETVQQLRLEGGKTVTDQLFFSVEPAVAVDSDLDALAIPAVGINWRPFVCEGFRALALQAVFGGALNPSGGDDDTEAALGFGVSHPVSSVGAVSFGHIWWGDGGDLDNGFYIGISLGDRAKVAGPED